MIQKFKRFLVVSSRSLGTKFWWIHCGSLATDRLMQIPISGCSTAEHITSMWQRGLMAR